MIINKMKDGKTIYKAWRENGERKYEMIDFKPYFYIKSEENRPPMYKLVNTLLDILIMKMAIGLILTMSL